MCRLAMLAEAASADGVAAVVAEIAVAVVAAVVVVEIAVGKCRKGRLKTWYESSERPCVGGRNWASGRIVGVKSTRKRKKEGEDRCLRGTRG